MILMNSKISKHIIGEYILFCFVYYTSVIFHVSGNNEIIEIEAMNHKWKKHTYKKKKSLLYVLVLTLIKYMALEKSLV